MIDKSSIIVIFKTLVFSSLFSTNLVNCNPDDGISRNESVTVQEIDLTAGNIQIRVINRGNFGRIQPEDNNNFGYNWKQNVQQQSSSSFEQSQQIDNTVSFDNDVPPPYYEVAKMARYIVKKSNWTSIATISARSPTTGFPFANIFSISDGPIGKSTGVPYMYVTPLDISIQDLKKNSRASLTMSLAQGNYCSNKLLDPEDPRCAHIILSGAMTKLVNGSAEETFARQSMFSRHPVMKEWPSDHGFFFAKLNIDSILVLDYFGGAKNVEVKDYYKANV